LGNVEHDVDINIDCKTTEKNIQISVKKSLDYYKLKQHEPEFEEERTELLDR
jgi:hypothetical protein